MKQTTQFYLIKKYYKLLAKNEIGEVVEEYAKLTKSSPILIENFKYHNVNQIHYQLKENNFFLLATV